MTDNGKKLDVLTGELGSDDPATRIANKATYTSNVAASFLEAMFSNRNFKPGQGRQAKIMTMVNEALVAASAVLTPTFEAQDRIDAMTEESEEKPREVH